MVICRFVVLLVLTLLATSCASTAEPASEPIIRLATTTSPPTTAETTTSTTLPPPTTTAPNPNPSIIDFIEDPSTLPTTSIAETPLDDGPQLIRIGTFLGADVPGQENSKYVLSNTGDVLHITNGNIFSGAPDYRTWNIGPEGFSQIWAKLQELQLHVRTVPNIIGSDSPAMSVSIDGEFVMEAHGLNLPASQLTPDQAQLRSRIHEMFELLDDMSWLDSVEPTEPELWVPNRMTLYARDEDNPHYYSTTPFDWPFEATIEEMTQAVTSEGERQICLSGDDAKAAWKTLMIDGVNHARLPVDDGSKHEVTIRVTYPGYQLFGDACEGASNVGNTDPPGLSDPDETELTYESLLEPLFFTGDDIPSSRYVPAPTPVGPPPAIDSCPGVRGPADIATDEFDTWLRSRVTATGALFRVDQIVGWAPEGADAVSVLEQIANYNDCDEPFKTSGIDTFESFEMANTPEGIEIGAVWILNGHSISADILLDNRIVMVVGFDSIAPVLHEDDLLPWIEIILTKVDAFESHLTLCTQAAESYLGSAEIGYLESCDGIADYLEIQNTWSQ